jgi:hypothetical protein
MHMNTTLINEEERTDWTQFPSVTLAYDMAMRALATSIDRSNMWSQTLERTLTWGTTIMLAVFGFVATQIKAGVHLDLCDPRLIAAIALLVAAFTVALRGRSIKICNFKLGDVHKTWLTLSEPDFQNTYIHAAIEFCDKNTQRTTKKVRANMLSTAFFMGSAILILWTL